MNEKRFRETVRDHGPAQTARMYTRLLRERKIDPETFRLRAAWEAFIGPVADTLDDVMRMPAGLSDMRLSQEAVRADAFTTVTTAVIVNFVQAGYNDQPSVLNDLVESFRSTNRVERLVGFTALDGPQDVEEGAEYPSADFSDRSVAAPEPAKRGLAIYITDEAIRFDHTGQIMSRARDVGKRIALDREKHGIKTIQDLTGFKAFYPNVGGTYTQKELYHNATSGGAWYELNDNLAAANPLTDWTSIETAMKLLKAMTDEKGEKIEIAPTHLLVPFALLATAAQIVNATEVRKSTASAANVSVSANAVLAAMGVGSLQIRSSPYMDDDTTWYIGDFRSQFKEQVLIDTEVRDAPGDTRRDIVAGFIARRKSRVVAVDDKFVIKNTA